MLSSWLFMERINNFDLPDPKSWGWGKKETVIMVLCGNQHKQVEMNSRLSLVHVLWGAEMEKV